MIIYTAENSFYFILFVSILSMLAGIATAIIELEKDEKLAYSIYTSAVIFKGAFIGAFAPVVMFLILLFIEPMAIEKLKLHLDISISALRFLYLGLALIFSRVLVLAAYRYIDRRGKEK